LLSALWLAERLAARLRRGGLISLETCPCLRRRADWAWPAGERRPERPFGKAVSSAAGEQEEPKAALSPHTVHGASRAKLVQANLLRPSGRRFLSLWLALHDGKNGEINDEINDEIIKLIAPSHWGVCLCSRSTYARPLPHWLRAPALLWANEQRIIWPA